MTLLTDVWELALDRLEADLDAVEAALASGSAEWLPAGWEPPQVPTRIPTHLVPRAVELLTRQDVVIARLTDAVVTVREQLSFVGTAHHDTAPAARPAAFLDQAL